MRWVGGLIAVTLVAAPAGAEPEHCRTDPALVQQIEALRAEVAALRAALGVFIQAETARVNVLQGQATALPVARPTPSPTPIASPTPSPSPDVGRRTPPVARVGVISGQVTLAEGVGPEAWVFVNDITEPPVKDATLDISQIDMAFVPAFSVVRRGTTVRFPNRDRLAHNVFSTTAGNEFDLGKYASDQPPRETRFMSPAIVDVFCNIHADMHASVLVVQNRYYAKVDAAGRFQLRDVPVGARTINAWAQKGKLAEVKQVIVSAGATTDLSLTIERGRPVYNPLRPENYR